MMTEAPPASKPSTAAYALFAALLGAYLANVAFSYFLTDDAYIYFRYAENWARGFGPVFNAGERVEGCTGFLWLALLTVLQLLGADLERAAVTLGVLCGAGTLVLVFELGRRASPARSPTWSLFAVAFLALNRTFAAWSAGGLETALFTLLATAGFARLFVEREAATRPWSAALLALAALTRPEGLLLLGFGAILRLTLRPRAPLAEHATWLLVAAAPPAAHLAFRLLYYQSWWPNTFYAKAPGTRWDLGAAYLAAFFYEHAGFLWAPLLAASWLAPSRQTRAPVAVLWAAGGAYLLYVAAIGGDAFEFRFMHVLLPALALGLQEGAFAAAGVLRGRRAAWGAALAVVVLPLSALLPMTVSHGWKAPPDGRNWAPLLPSAAAALPRLAAAPGFRSWFAAYDRAYRAIGSAAAVRNENLRVFWRGQLREGEFWRLALARGLVRPDESISLGCVGVIPYVNRMTTVDELGLTDAYVARLPLTQRGPLGHEREAPWAYLTWRRVDYVSPTGEGFFLDDQVLDRVIGVTERPLYFVPFEGRVFAFFSPAAASELAARFAARGFPLFVVSQGMVRSLRRI